MRHATYTLLHHPKYRTRLRRQSQARLPRSGITNDPNRKDDERYILCLIGQVMTVSLKTQKIIATLPSLNFPT